MFGNSKTFSTLIVRPADTTAYSAGDVIGPAVAATTSFSKVGSDVTGASGYINKVLLQSSAPITGALQLWLFNAATVNVVDNAAFDFDFAHSKNLIGTLPLTTPVLTASNVCMYQNSDIRLAFKLGVLSDLFFLLETITGFTPVSGQQFNLILQADFN